VLIDRRPKAAGGLGVFSQLEFPLLWRRFKERMPARIRAGNHVQPPLPIHQNIAILWHRWQRRTPLPLPRPDAPIDHQTQIVTPAQNLHLLAPAHDIGLIVAPTAGPASPPQLRTCPIPNLLDFKSCFYRRTIFYGMAFHTDTSPDRRAAKVDPLYHFNI